jgi:sirohydrochlorin ferrochelatase
MSTLILTAHGSADPRSVANTRAVAGHLRRVAPELDVRVAFCEQSTPNLRDVLPGVTGDVVVTPFLLASAYHARVDIPALIADSTDPRAGVVRQADVLGEDDRLLHVMGERLTALGVSRFDPELGVLIVAVGSSSAAANVRTATIAEPLSQKTRWAGVEVAFATGATPSVSQAAQRLRERGAARLVIAPWFLAHGRITDRVADYARRAGIPMAEPLGAHRLVAATVLDRFEEALALAGLAA